MRRITQHESDHLAGQDRRAGDGADPDDFSARSLVEVFIFGGGAVFEHHQERRYVANTTLYHRNDHQSMERTGDPLRVKLRPNSELENRAPPRLKLNLEAPSLPSCRTGADLPDGPGRRRGRWL